MKFTEFYNGYVFDVGSHQVTAAEILAFAGQFDPQPFHIDEAAARASRWEGLIASGFHTCSIAMRLMVDHVLAGSESMGSPGIEQVKWRNPVRPGDTLRLTVQVLDAKRSGSGKVGVVRWRWIMVNQREQSVLDLIVTSLFELHQEEGGAP